MYSTERAELVAAQLERFAALPHHHLAGHVANREFWLGEAEHAIAVLDGYKARFERLRDAQAAWAEAHDVRVPTFCARCGGGCTAPDEHHPEVRPPPPRRASSSDLDAARARVKDAVYTWLVRAHRAGMLDGAELTAAVSRVGASVDPRDLR
jgi:hypothetical protein